MTITPLTRRVLGALAVAGALAAAAVCGTSCKGGGDGGGGDKTPDTSAENRPAQPEAPRSVRETLHTWRPLIDEAGRAELRVGGVLVDFGTADQHKYTRGGWATGWASIVVDSGPSRCRASGASAHLDVVLDKPATRLVLSARSDVDGQRVTVRAGGTTLGEAAIGAEWSAVSIALSEPLPAGRVDLELAFAKGGESDARAEVDWLWLTGAADGDAPAVTARVLPIEIGGEPRRSIIAPTARTYSFYLDVPAAATLVFDTAADGEATFVVTAHTDGAEPRELFRRAATGAWQEHAVDLASLAGKTVRLDLTTVGGATRAGWGEPEISIDGPAPQPAVATAKPARSAVVILIDTLRADSFEPFGSRKVNTPSYDAFAAKATVFANAYDNENWTKPSVATLLSGMYPSTHDAKRDESKLPDEVELLSQHLQGNGFTTAGFVANGYISEHFGFERGWNQFHNYIRESDDSQAERVYGDALAWLREHKDERFFLYIQTIDPHVDCDVDAKYWSQYFDGTYDGPLGDVIDAMDQRNLSSGKLVPTDRDLAWLRAMYDGEITYHDEHMGAFLAELDALGIADTTLVAITNDHGEELGDHGKFGHGHNLYEYMVRAPLTIRYAPAFPPGGRVDDIVEHVDFAPTLVDVLGVDPMSKADGTSLLELVRGQDVRQPSYAVIEMLGGRRAVRVGPWKLVRSHEEGWDRLFDLSADPGETNEVSAAHPIALRAAEVYMGEGLGMPVKRERARDVAARNRFKATKAKISPAARRGLEALGYFGDH